ncbi:MAG: DUF3078 domain-containing protein [Ginsengibacter sp.]
MKKNYNPIVRIAYIIIVLVFLDQHVFGQTQTVKDLKEDASREVKKGIIDSSKIWNKGGIFNLNLGQASQNNWAAGGDNFSFSLASYIGLYAFYKKERWSWDNTLDLNYGIVNTSSLGTRKNDDRIDLLSKAGYNIAPKLDLAGIFNFRSQFTKGYTYYADGSKTLLSNFMAPGYILLGLGFDYKPANGLSIFLSPITSRWIIVNDDTLSAKGAYGVTPGKKIKNEIGAYASITYLKDLSKTITYNGRLDLFSNYEHNPQNVAVMMNNMFTAKLSKILSASLGLNLIYDDDIKLFGPNHDSPGLQTQSLLAVGLSVKL